MIVVQPLPGFWGPKGPRTASSVVLELESGSCVVNSEVSGSAGGQGPYIVLHGRASSSFPQILTEI